MHRKDILETARDLTCGERDVSYGTPHENFKAIADLWNAYLTNKYRIPPVIQPMDAAMLMDLGKATRTFTSPENPDHYVDGSAYRAIAGELATNVTPTPPLETILYGNKK